MKKRILSILLCLCMALSLLPATALAVTDEPSVSIGQTLVSGKYYTIADATVTESDSAPASGGYLAYTLDGSNATLTVTGDVTFSDSIPALSITACTLTLTGSGNLSMTSSGPTVAGSSGSLTTSNYTGNLSFTSTSSNAITNCTDVTLETTGALTVSGYGSSPTISCGNDVILKGSTVSLTNGASGQLVSAVGSSVSITVTNGDLSLSGNSDSPLIIADSNSNNQGANGAVTLSASGDISVNNSGIGMAVCSALTATAGGDVTLESTSGIAVGSNLTVTKAANVTVSGGRDSAPAVTGAANITASGDINIASAFIIDIGGTANLTAGGFVIRTTSAGTTITTVDGTSCAYGSDVSTSGLDLSSSAPADTTCYKAGSGYILYTPAVTGDTPANAKLELHGATINMTTGRALYLPSAAPVDITVTGDNSLTAYSNSIDGNSQAVNITGTGNLTINGYYGICSTNGNMSGVTINIGGDLKIKTSGNPITGVSGDVAITAKSITIGDAYGVHCSGIASLEATGGDISLTGGSSSGAVYGSNGVSLKASGNITVDNHAGGIALSTAGTGAVIVDAQGDVAITAGTSVAIYFGTGVSVTSHTGSVDVTTDGYSCMELASGGAGGGTLTLNAAKDIALNAESAAISATSQAVNITAGSKLSSTSYFGLQVGALTIKANEVSIAGTQQDGIQATSVAITNPTGGNCKSVSIVATSSDSSRAAIHATGDATSGNITVKADELFISGKTSASAISALGTVTIEGTGVIVGAISAGTKSIAAGVTCAANGGDVSTSGLDLSTPPAEATAYTAGSGYIVWNPTGNTLTLHNARINNTSGCALILPSDTDTTVVAQGDNTLESSENALSDLKYITIQGSGSLSATSSSGYSIYSALGITITGVVSVTAPTIYSCDNIVVDTTGTVDAPQMTTLGTLTYNKGTMNGSWVSEYNGNEHSSVTLSIYGNVTLDSDTSLDSNDASLTVKAGAVLTIDTDRTLTIAAGVPITNNGTIVNSGTIVLPETYAADIPAAIKAMKLTGSGVVEAGSQYYTNDGAAVKAITGGLTLTSTGDDTKSVDKDGYSWDGSTLTLGSTYVSGGLTLPDNTTIRTTSGSIISGSINGAGGTNMHLTFDGTAPLSINGGISLGTNGDTVTVQSGAHVSVSGSFSLGAYGLDGILNVIGSGTVLTISSPNSYAVMCGAVNVQDGASLAAHSEGSYGLYALTDGVSVTGGSTLTVGCDYGVYVKDGSFTIDESSTFTANAAVAAICVVDTTKTKSQGQMLKVPSSMLPSGAEIAHTTGDTPNCGYTYWSIMPTGNILSATNEDSDPATLTGALGALTLKAATVPSNPIGGGGGSVSSYTLTFETNGGSSVASLSKTSGTVVDLSNYKPTRDGYDFAGWYSDAALTAKITGVTLTKDTTVYAKWTEKSANPFTDVSDSAYYHDAVLWAAKKNITSGTSDNAFSPDVICTRAQMVTFLWRAMGSPEPASADCPFTDVPKDAYYYKAVLWASDKGVAKGTSAAAFSPNDTVTRSQSMTFLWRAAGEPVSVSANQFADVSQDAYYYSAVLWAIEKGVTQGTSSTAFSPNDGCTRAQIVTFLYRYMGE